MPTEAVVIAFFATGLQLMVPILLAALGETISERSGVLNVGIEGSMLIGALITALVGINIESVSLALVLGWIAGMGAGVVLAFLYVYRGTDQIVTRASVQYLRARSHRVAGRPIRRRPDRPHPFPLGRSPSRRYSQGR